MNIDPRTAPLHEWNRLARENAENAIVSSMFDAALKSSEHISSFCNWLLLATATVASFVLANSDKVISLIGKTGFIVAGVLLCLSCIFGLVSTVFALRCKIGIDTSVATNMTFDQHLSKYEEEESKILENAAFWGITLQTGIRTQRVLEEFLKPFPFWVRWLARRHFDKHANNPQIAHVSQIASLNVQGMSAFIQAICFITFFVAAFIFAASI
jgi:hypothetical protein